MPDVANEEVTGISRYIPTTLSKSVLASLIPTAVTAFVLVRQNPDWFGMQGLQSMHQTAIAIAVCLAVALILTIIVIVDLAVLIYSKKHSRIWHHKSAS